MWDLIANRTSAESYETRFRFSKIYKGVKNELKVALQQRGVTPSVRFIIFAQGRTGSTLLTSTLDKHPRITCHDEILGVPRLFPIQYMKNLASLSPNFAFGFHAKIYQLEAWQRITDVNGWLSRLDDEGWKIIYVRRENLVRHVVSNAFARAAGRYHHFKQDTVEKPKEIKIPVDYLLRSIEWRKENLLKEQLALNGLPFTELVYEKDLETPDKQTKTFHDLQSALEIDPIDLTPPLKKAVTRPLSELIVNFDEIKDALSNREEIRYLE